MAYLEIRNVTKRFGDFVALNDVSLDVERDRMFLTDLGGTPLPGSPADFGKLIADETEKWAKVIRAAHIKAE